MQITTITTQLLSFNGHFPRWTLVSRFPCGSFSFIHSRRISEMRLFTGQVSLLLPTIMHQSTEGRTQHYGINLNQWLSNVLSTSTAGEKKGKGSPYSITNHRVPELIPVLGSQPACNVSHKHGGRLPLLSARPAVTPTTLKKAATNFAAWWTETQWVWTVCLRLLPESIVTAIWTWAFLHWVQHANHSATKPPFHSWTYIKRGIAALTPDLQHL